VLDTLATGPVGLLLGALIGLVLTVLFEDQLKEFRAVLVRRLRLNLIKRPPSHELTTFSMGPLKTGVRIVEGDGEEVIAEDAIHVFVDPEMVILPDEVAQWRKDIEEQETEKRKRARKLHGTVNRTRSNGSW